jgi:hypothetical protein
MMMRTLCVALLLVPSAALQVKKDEPAKEELNANATVKVGSPESPKNGAPEGVEVLWQRPHGEPKGILLYLHGCHGRATGMWTSDGKDGFHFDVCDTTKKKKCMGYTEEVLMRQKARSKGYAVVAVSGGVGSPRGCMNTNDVPRIQLAMQYVVEQEPDLADKPVILTGHSSGGRVLPELLATGAGVRNAKCIVPIADEIRVKGDSGAPLGLTPNYPEDVSAFFVHMERDGGREENIVKNIAQMKAKGVRTSDIKIPYAVSVTPKLFEADGYGMKPETAKKLHRALQEAQLVDARGVLTRNPYAVGNNWQEAFKKKGLINEAGGYQTIQQYMDVAWSEHWMAGGRYLDQILEFCEKPGNKRIHEGGNANFDLKSKVASVNAKADAWKKQQAKQYAKSGKDKAKKMGQAAQMGAMKAKKEKK